MAEQENITPDPLEEAFNAPAAEGHPEAESVETTEDAAEAVEAELQDAVEAESADAALAAERLDSLLRLQAEFTNFKNRTAREKEQLRGFVTSELVTALLPVFDDIDANGIVHVSAKDKGTGVEQSMTITGGTSLSKDDIDRMVKDAEAHAEQDKARREAADTRNEAESVAYTTEKLLKENGDKLPENVKTEVQGDVDELKKALEGDDDAAVKSAFEKLQASRSKLGEALYAAAQAEASESKPAADEDVVDAEVIDEDEKK